MLEMEGCSRLLLTDFHMHLYTLLNTPISNLRPSFNFQLIVNCCLLLLHVEVHLCYVVRFCGTRFNYVPCGLIIYNECNYVPCGLIM